MVSCLAYVKKKCASMPKTKLFLIFKVTVSLHFPEK